jgi:modified peptide precursor CbpA
MKKTQTTKDLTKNGFISYRKSCNPQGTGLSHYIVIDDKKVEGK